MARIENGRISITVAEAENCCSALYSCVSQGIGLGHSGNYELEYKRLQKSLLKLTDVMRQEGTTEDAQNDT